MGAWSSDDEQAALGLEFTADAARTLRTVASLLMPAGKTYDAELALRWEHPNRPDPESEPAEMSFEDIDAAIAAALPRG